MKLITYNILCGGRTIANSPDRRDDILKLIKQHSPDVVALQEANLFDQDGMLQRVSSELSLPFYALSQGALYENNQRYHVVTFSRYPIISTHDFPDGDFQSAALSVLLETETGPVSVCNVHLHSYVEEKRMQELDSILKYQSQFQDRIILGDFNAISRVDGYTSAVTEFNLIYDVTDQMRIEHIDLFAQKTKKPAPSYPTQGVSDHSYSESRRIDYMFASRDLSKRLTSAVVDTSNLAHQASDHFPLIAVL